MADTGVARQSYAFNFSDRNDARTGRIDKEKSSRRSNIETVRVGKEIDRGLAFVSVLSDARGEDGRTILTP